ncbi:neuropeptides capa receptor-like [Pollicipes pollicipes]|uniref:neuropeptides capa receptor-like n=1 Tax=Pollicipes pollicipes TaxID=41117 RepID=UPI001884C06E|nr:neuropeptides capa receptor-like [Pollicipes pollicipes]
MANVTNITDPYEYKDAATFLQYTVGPKYLPLEVVLPITIVYVIIFVTGVVGNVAVCLVIIKNSALQTATNYYLFSLAVSDLAVLVLGLPNDLKVYWQQYPWGLGVALCKIRALVSEMTSYVSVLIIVAFSLERYLAICHPLLSYTMAGLRRACRIIAGIWLVSLLAATPFAFYTNVHYLEFPKDSGMYLETICYMPNEWPLTFSSFVFFIAPMTSLLFVYLCIGVQIRRAATIGGNLEGSVSGGEARQRGNRKAILRMLVAVVIGFFVCFAPHHAQRLLYIYGKDLPNYREINEYMYYITGCFYYFSATINPILYNVMSAKYRQAFKETLCGKRRPASRYSVNHTLHHPCVQHQLNSSTKDTTGTTGTTGSARREPNRSPIGTPLLAKSADGPATNGRLHPLLGTAAPRANGDTSETRV